MNNVQKIIDLFGGIAGFTHVRINADGFMPLCIERIGDGPRNLPLFSVCHYGEMNGDAMRDPEMTFEVAPDGRWLPVSFRNDYVGCCQEGEAGAVFSDENGRVMIRPKLVRELQSFARTWNRNIGEHGFVDAARFVSAAN